MCFPEKNRKNAVRGPVAGCCCRALVPNPCPSGCTAEAALSRHPKGLGWVSSLACLHCGVGTLGFRGEAGGELFVPSPSVPLSKAGTHIWADRPNRLLLTMPLRADVKERQLVSEVETEPGYLSVQTSPGGWIKCLHAGENRLCQQKG